MEVKKEKKEVGLGWKIAKIGVRVLGGLGAGILIGAGLAGIDTSKYKGLTKAAIALGAVGLADCCGEAASKQLEKRVDDAHDAFDFGQKVADKLIPDNTEEEEES